MNRWSTLLLCDRNLGNGLLDDLFEASFPESNTGLAAPQNLASKSEVG